MAHSNVLLVEQNGATVRRLHEAISATTLPPPIHRPDGESAVLWIGAHECGLCIVNSDLPGIDGLETLARLRNRVPDLPAIMFSGSSSQELAIAAFRYGVVDFVPMNGDYARAVAEIAERTLQGRSGRSADGQPATTDPRLRDLPAERLEPTYQNRLRVIGRQFDIYGYRSINVVEVPGGFLVRALPAHSRVPEALEFPDRDFQSHVLKSIDDQSSDESNTAAPRSDLAPTGYEDLMRAVGHRLDEMSAESIVINELHDVVIVGGRGQSDLHLAATIEPFHMFLRQHDVEYLLNDAFRRRGVAPPQRQSKRDPEPTGLKGIFKRLN